MMADAIAQTLGNAIRAWTGAEGSAAASAQAQGDTEQTFWLYQAPPHRCTANCKGYTEWEGTWARAVPDAPIPSTQEGAPAGQRFVEEVD